MAKAPTIEYASIDELFLDQKNPRLGRRNIADRLSQAKILEEMSDWTLDELAISFLENGFWPQEALIVVREKLGNKNCLVVVEGNRRLAALKLLKRAAEGGPVGRFWSDLVQATKPPSELFSEIPYILVTKRSAVSAYLGFRHVSGIKQWEPAEKAQFIASLIEDEKMSYEQVRRRIGSKTTTVRQMYISYRLLLQMDAKEDIDVGEVEKKFSVLYLSLRTRGVQTYLHIDIEAGPKKAERPVPKEHLVNLARFSRWLFGDEKTPPIFTDSRNVDAFGKILESEDAVQYLERTDQPRFEIAQRKAGVGQEDFIALILRATDNTQLALTEAHQYKRDDAVRRSVEKLALAMAALVSVFPTVKKALRDEINADDGTS